MDKRSKLLKLIINSDDEGIEKIYKKIFSNNTNVPFTKEDLDEACKSVCAKMIVDVPGRILIMDEYVEFAVRIEKLLFKEEK